MQIDVRQPFYFSPDYSPKRFNSFFYPVKTPGTHLYPHKDLVWNIGLKFGIKEIMILHLFHKQSWSVPLLPLFSFLRINFDCLYSFNEIPHDFIEYFFLWLIYITLHKPFSRIFRYSIEKSLSSVPTSKLIEKLYHVLHACKENIFKLLSTRKKSQKRKWKRLRIESQLNSLHIQSEAQLASDAVFW